MTNEAPSKTAEDRSEGAGAWKIAAVGVAGAILGSLIGVWGGVLATDRQLDAEHAEAALQRRAQAYEGFLAAVDDVKMGVETATNFTMGPMPGDSRPVLTAAVIEDAVKGLLDLPYGLSAPQAKVRIYGSVEAATAAAALGDALNKAVARAVVFKGTTLVATTEPTAKREALSKQLQEVELAQTHFIDVAQRDLP